MSELNAAKLEQFVKLGGYEIVKQVRSGKHKGKWRNKSEAARRTKLSRPTIDAILEQYPEKPSKVKPKFMESLEESEGFRRIQEMYKARVSSNAWYKIVYTLQKAVPIVGYNKDPASWNEEDYHTLWYHPVFHSEECKGIGKAYATALRQLMKATNNHAFLDKFKYNNPPEGKKKQWFLHTEELRKLIQKIDTKETLALTFLGVGCGARHSALELITPDKIDFNDNILQVYEPKVQGYVLKYPAVSLLRFLQTYIEDKKIQPNEKLFPHSYAHHLTQLRKAGKDAGLRKKISTHILKHTFVSQCHRHGVSGSTISNQTGTELRCLVKFYRAEDERLLRNEMQGVEYKHKPFYQWIDEISYFFRARYEELKE